MSFPYNRIWWFWQSHFGRLSRRFNIMACLLLGTRERTNQLTPGDAAEEDLWLNAAEHVLASITVPAETLQTVRKHWIRAFRSGSPRIIRLALTPLANTNWDWPEFDRWQTRFKEIQEWPYMWSRCNVPEAIEAGDANWLRQAKIDVLDHTLMTKAYSRVRFERMANFFSERGWRIADGGCKVERQIAELCKPDVSMNDWQTWPPFFPGDRSSVTGS